MEGKLIDIVRNAYAKKHRLVAPLVGFPGVKMTGSTIKLAQQNCKEHFKILKELYNTFKPDIIFPLMDLSVEANALGRYTVFPKDESATVVFDSFNIKEIEELENIDIKFDGRVLGYVETLQLMNNGLPESVFKGAYVTGPYTLAALLMGAEEAAISTILKPEQLHLLCDLSTKKILDYVESLVSAGAQLICILEPSAVMLGPAHFQEFSMKYVQTISEYCRNTGTASVYHVCGNSMHLIEKMCESGVDALSLDSKEAGVNLTEVAERIHDHIVLIGNVSPIGSILNAKKEKVEDEVCTLLKSMERHPNFILSTGCDLPQETPLENILAFMDAGKNYRIN